MNLLGRRSGLFFLVALVFFSCEDELNTVGSGDGQDDLALQYKEFTLPSKVALFDSVRTDNTSRLLVGQYVDPTFGTVKSTAYSVYGINLISDVFKNNAVIDSVVLDYAFDMYYYGKKTAGMQDFSFNIHTVTEQITTDEAHLNYSTAPYDPFPLENVMVRYNTDSLDLYNSQSNPDTTLTVSVKLPNSYVLELANAITQVDTALYNITEHMYGFALVPEVAEHVLGINPSSLGSSLKVYYHNSSSSAQLFNFSLFTSNSFNQIEVDRAGTPLAGLTALGQGDDLEGIRYTQGASGVFTQLDLSEYLAFTNAVENLSINSLELVVEPISIDAEFEAPSSYNLRHSNSSFQFENLTIDGNEFQTAFSDQYAPLDLFPGTNDDEKDFITSFPTLYFQTLYDNKVQDANLVLLPSNYGSTLDRMSFDKNDVKLKLYYTVPVNK